MQVEPQDVGRLPLEVRVGARDVALQPVGFQPCALPHAMHRGGAHAEALGEAADGPVGVGRRGRPLGRRDDLGFARGTQPIGAARARRIPQPHDPGAVEPPLPAADAAGGEPELRGDRLVRGAGGQGENQPGAAGQPHRDARGAGHGLQLGALHRRELEGEGRGEHARRYARTDTIATSETLH